MTDARAIRQGAMALCLVAGMAVGRVAWAEERVALVIGVTDYTTLEDVPGAAEDASNIAAALTLLDYEVTVLTNPSHAGLTPLLESFSDRVQEADTVVVYFAGHGMQREGVNYLVPGDAMLQQADLLARETWPLAEVLQTVAAKGQWPRYQTLVFLDTSHEMVLPVADATGLASVAPERGVFLASAAQPGAVAIPPKSGDRSLFAAALLRHLETEGISVSDMLARVRGEVVRLTDESQIPWARSNLTTQVYLSPVLEEGTVITANDLETWSALDSESRERLLAALGRNGVLLEIVEVEEEDAKDRTDIASLLPTSAEIGLVIEDIDSLPTEARAPLDTAFQDTPDTIARLSPGPGAPGTSDRSETAVDGRPVSERIEDLVKKSPGGDVTDVKPITPDGQAEDSAEPVVDLPANLALAIQQELTRVGCHRASVDGIWGRVSTVSLLRFYAQRGEVTEEQAAGQPTATAFGLLKQAEGVVCEGVIAPQIRTSGAQTVAPKATRVVVRQVPVSSTPPRASSTSKSTGRIQSTITKTETGETRAVKKIQSGVFR